MGCGCPKCGLNKLSNTFSLGKEGFINKSKKRHSDKYDYSKVEYVNNRTPVVIICPVHGEFSQKPDKHIIGHGCPKCAEISRANKRRKTTEWFIEKSKEKHANKYDYSKTKFTGVYNDVVIICPQHGEFIQKAINHLNGRGCKKCSNREPLTYEKVASNLSKCKTKSEFEKRFPGSYAWARRHQILDEIYEKFGIENQCNLIKRGVYSYIIEYEGKCYIYVGLTYNFNKRHLQHINNVSKKDSLAIFCSKIGIQIPQYKIEYNYEEPEMASKHEKEILEKYIKMGYIPINIAKCGSLGGKKKKFSCTFEECKAIASEFNTRQEWRAKASYYFAKDNGWLDLLMPSKMPNRGKKIRQVDKEGNTIAVFKNSKDAAKKVFGCNEKAHQITQVCSGRIKTTGGCYFEYV